MLPDFLVQISTATHGGKSDHTCCRRQCISQPAEGSSRSHSSTYIGSLFTDKLCYQFCPFPARPVGAAFRNDKSPSELTLECSDKFLIILLSIFFPVYKDEL